jgi:hypothetical protein
MLALIMSGDAMGPPSPGELSSYFYFSTSYNERDEQTGY